MSNAWGSASAFINETIKAKLKGIEGEVTSRAYRASNEMRNASLYVLRGQGGGRSYRVSGTNQTYTASAPGSPPAVRTGAFRNSWGTRVNVEKAGSGLRAVSAIESNLSVGKYVLGELLENGTSRMASRPYKEKIIERALPKVKAIYSAPYNV